MPPEAESLFVDPDPHYDAESLALYSQDPAELSDTQIEQRARLIVSRMEAQLPPERLAALAGSIDTESVRHSSTSSPQPVTPTPDTPRPWNGSSSPRSIDGA